MKRLIALSIASLAMLTSSLRAEEKLMVGGGPVAEVPQFIVANDRKLWSKSDLAVSVTPFATGREAFEALMGGQLDLAIMTEFPAVVGAMRNQNFSVVSVLSRYKANRIIAKRGEPLKSVAELAGAQIGVTVGTNSHFMLDEALKAAGVKATIVNVAPPDIVPALSRGDIAAAAPFPSFYAGARRTLGAMYQELIVPSYETTMLVAASSTLIEKRPEVLAKFIKGLVEGQAIVDKEPAAAQETIARVLGGASSLETIKAAWGEYEYKVVLDQRLTDLLLREGKWVRDLGVIKNVEPTDAMFRGRIAPATLKSVAPAAVSLP
jgi:NitT/TauT family transport system substrate-binding protein